ncbi:MAG: MFS transporter [Geminicoccaceae bacterium]|nr:MFS transporter [Geminicoccaceae bacterium]
MKSYLSFVRAEARWLFFGVVLTFTGNLGQTFFISLFNEPIRQELGLGHADFASLYAIGTIFGSLVLFWIGRAIDHNPVHLITGFTLVGLAAAGAVLASSTGVVTLTIAFLMLRLCGQGMSTHIAITCMARWFARNRGKAISIASLGAPIGEALLPPLVVVLLGAMQWRDVWWLFATIVAAILAPLCLMLVWHGERTPKRGIDDAPDDDEIPSWSRAQVLRDPRFWLMLPTTTGPAWILTAVFFHQGVIVATKGWEFSTFALAFTAFAVTKVAVGLLTGTAIDRFTAARIAPLTMPVMCAALVILALSAAPSGAWLFMTTIGVHVGMNQTTMSALWPELYGRRYLGAIKALMMSLGVFASALGPPIFGFGIDNGMALPVLLLGCAAYSLMATALTVIALRRPAQR